MHSARIIGDERTAAAWEQDGEHALAEIHRLDVDTARHLLVRFQASDPTGFADTLRRGRETQAHEGGVHA